MSNKSNNILPTILLLWLLQHQIVWCININCVTEESPTSGGAGTQISTTCSDSSHTLVSCGFKTVDTLENDVGGSWITGQTCYARNVDSNLGVVAIARCCDLSEYSVSCNTLESQISGTVNNDKIDVSCSASQTLMGCTARSIGDRMDGSYPGKATDYPFDLVGTVVSNPDSCTGWNADTGEGIRSYATCCSSPDNKVTFQCEAVWSALSTNDNIYFSCPNANQFMTSCSAANDFRDMNLWQIGPANDCALRNTHKRNANAPGFGIAICCTATTLSPSPAPTTNPTPAPTINPTHLPTNPPSTTPTQNPTPAPTSVPTPSPTNNPTPSPTSNPTTSPTFKPTANPTRRPSNHPTIADRDAGVSDDPTQSPQVTNAHNNNTGGRTGIIDDDPLLDYLLYTVFGLIFMICLLCCCMLLQKKLNERKQKIQTMEQMEKIPVNSKSGVKSVEMTGDLPPPPERDNNNNNDAIISLAHQDMILSMAMQPIPSMPKINNDMQYIEGLNRSSMSSVKSLIPAEKNQDTPQFTTQGNDVRSYSGSI